MSVQIFFPLFLKIELLFLRSFGVLAWEVVTRQAPFADMDLYKAANKIKKGMTLPIPIGTPSTFSLVNEKKFKVIVL